ncbi:carboxylesterase/lipase family protein [soil metagenome]
MMNRREMALGAVAGGLAMSAASFRPAVAAGPKSGGAPVVRTTYGPVIGGRDDGVLVFKGVRYGADTSSRRFQAPVAPTPWTEPVEALAYGSASPQRGDEPNESEDCLFLNVWTPGADTQKRAVMVYIHGGAYSNGSGSSPMTDGKRLAARSDVVVVSLNHRLNVFGYAYLARLAPGFDVSGNAGQLDLILALRWVRDNIASFGGDPERVMVFGQSGGGAKIATLMATPAADGLFHRAATMSGQQVTASGPINATVRAKAWLKAMDLTPEQAAEAATLPVTKLLEGMAAEDPILGYGGLYFGPVMDDRVLFRHPFYPDAAPQGVRIPMLIGNCHDETLAFMGGDPANAGLSWETLPGRMGPGVMRIDISPETVIAEYRRLHPEMTPDQVLIAATTAGRSWRGAVIEAEERARSGHPAWVYQQTYPFTTANGRMGAGHGSDIALVFDTVRPDSARPDVRAVVDQVSGAFAAFAKVGDPNHEGLPNWEKYDLARRQTMVFDVNSHMEDDPRGDERTFYARVPYVQPGT